MGRSVDCRSLRRAVLVLVCLTSASRAAEVLPSWNDGPSKRAILKFVADVTTNGSPSFVPVADRLAVFHNDATLWCEPPVYIQFAFPPGPAKGVAAKHPGWTTPTPASALHRRDTHAIETTS